MRRRLAFTALVLAALALGAGVLGAFRLKRYVDSDPRLCALCHRASPEFALWAGGSHKSVSCQRCHHSTPEQGVAMLRAFLLGRVPGGGETHAPVEIGACAQCHLKHDGNWPQVGGSRGHRIHYEQQKISCVTCHAARVHGFRPLTDACRQCHGEHLVRVRGMARLHCFTCHDFLARDPGLRPTRRDCLRCHQASGVHPARFADDAPMQFPCGTCHKPHAASDAAALVACATCHKGVAGSGLHAAGGHQRCGECHSPHLWRPSERECLRCHGGAEGHARGRACLSCHSFAARKAAPGKAGR